MTRTKHFPTWAAVSITVAAIVLSAYLFGLSQCWILDQVKP